MLEHLSFRLGNQLFFVCLDTEGVTPFSAGTARALRAVAEGCRGHACAMPMRKTPSGWQAAAPGWGLLNMATNLSRTERAAVGLPMPVRRVHGMYVRYKGLKRRPASLP